MHEDFLDDEMNEVAEKYLNNSLKTIEIQLVSIITYDEVTKLKKENEEAIKHQIKEIIAEKYHVL